uniref:Uncharacterized protein n=1 Tax=Anguilla anguilla TaxID=7936 RepID=A0A0E9U4F7_ANGAN
MLSLKSRLVSCATSRNTWSRGTDLLRQQ